MFQRKREKILSINANPFISSYSYYAFPMAIISSDTRIGMLVSSFSIIESCVNDFKILGNMSRKNSKNWNVYSSNEYKEKCNACLYRKLKDNDFLEIEISYQQYTNAWSAVNIFVTSEQDDLLQGDDSFLYRFGRFIYDGINIHKEGKKCIESLSEFRGTSRVRFGINRDGTYICFYVVSDGIKHMIYQEELEITEEEGFVIGVQVKHGDNMFYRWLNRNYIQLSCDIENRDRRLEFLYGVEKHWGYNSFNYFLDVNTYDYNVFIELGGIRYIKNCIDRGRYIFLMLDQTYVEGREEYGFQHHMHQNVVYGYSDKEKKFFVLGYTNKGKVIESAICYKDMEKSITENRNDIEVVNYVQDAYFYNLECGYILEQLKEYLQGENSKKHIQYLRPEDNRVYGLKIYEELVKDKGIEILITDRRVAHLLWEHKRMMKERIRYLQHCGVFSDYVVTILVDDYEKICKKVYNLKNILLKYQFRPEKADYALIREMLDDLCESERKVLTIMIEQWKK